MRKKLAIVLTGVVAAGVVAAIVRLARRPGELQGLRYRLLGGRPDPDVDDDTLADRIRSTIGPLQKRLDLPRIDVRVDDHVAVLGGYVGTAADAEAIEGAVRRVSGVTDVQSHLEVGLPAGVTRPSEGRRAAPPPSDAKKRLLAAATSAGADDDHADGAVRATLSVLAERIPDGERQQFLGHLPTDVRDMVEPPLRLGPTAGNVRTVADLVAAVVTEEPGIADGRITEIVAAVVAEARRLAPDEADDVAAALPKELKDLWAAGAPT